MLKRAKRRASASSSRSLMVDELLERYLQALENPATRKTTAYHITSILDIFGKRRALRMTLDDIDGLDRRTAVQRRRRIHDQPQGLHSAGRVQLGRPCPAYPEQSSRGASAQES